MKSLKKFTLLFSAVLFCLSVLAVSAAQAQPGRARWDGNRGNHRGWTKARNWNRRDQRWDRRNSRLDRRNDRSFSRGRLSESEWQRLERRRARLNSRADRFGNDGRINNREQYRLYRQYNRYNRTYRRSIRN